MYMHNHVHHHIPFELMCLRHISGVSYNVFSNNTFFASWTPYFFMSKQYTHSPQSSLLHAQHSPHLFAPVFSNLQLNLLKKIDVYLLLGGWSYKWALVQPVVELWSMVEGLVKWLTNQHESKYPIATQLRLASNSIPLVMIMTRKKFLVNPIS